MVYSTSNKTQARRFDRRASRALSCVRAGASEVSPRVHTNAGTANDVEVFVITLFLWVWPSTEAGLNLRRSSLSFSVPNSQSVVLLICSPRTRGKGGNTLTMTDRDRWRVMESFSAARFSARPTPTGHHADQSCTTRSRSSSTSKAVGHTTAAATYKRPNTTTHHTYRNAGTIGWQSRRARSEQTIGRWQQTAD